MPLVDYQTYANYQDQRRKRLGLQGLPPLPGAPGAPSPGAIGQYQAPRFGQIDKETGQYTKDVAIAAAQGFTAGGPIGAAIAATAAAAPQWSRSGRRAWDAAKAGDTEGVSRSLAPISPLFYLNAKTKGKIATEMMGMPSWTNPMNLTVKGIAELFGGSRTNIEEKRWERLKKAGFDVPKWVEEKAEVPVNETFAKTRNEADLTGKDITQYAVLPETFGKLWKQADTAKREEVGNYVAQNQLAREQKGTLDINWTPDTLTMAQQILMGPEGAAGVQGRFYIPPEYVHPLERAARAAEGGRRQYVPPTQRTAQPEGRK